MHCPSSGGQRTCPSSARPMPSCKPTRGLGLPRKRFRSATWIPNRPFPGTPNAELTGTQRRGARAVRPMMTKAAARPGCHAVACPVERLVRRLDGTVQDQACGSQRPSRCRPERGCWSRGHCVPLDFMADDAGARCGAHHQEDSERVRHRRVRCQAAGRSAVLAFRRERFRSETWVPTRPFPGTPNAELTGATRRAARAVRRMMDRCAGRPWPHAVARPVERFVRRLDGTVRG
jgi:hypothetical protein